MEGEAGGRRGCPAGRTSDRRLFDHCDAPVVAGPQVRSVVGHRGRLVARRAARLLQRPQRLPGRVLIRERLLLRQRQHALPPLVQDARHLALLDQVVLVLAHHQVVLHLVARGDAVAQVLELLQQVVGKVHVRDALLGYTGELRLVPGLVRVYHKGLLLLQEGEGGRVGRLQVQLGEGVPPPRLGACLPHARVVGAVPRRDTGTVSGGSREACRRGGRRSLVNGADTCGEAVCFSVCFNQCVKRVCGA